ncbi:hypothetical protein P171DRAFT_526748 [Karstenula rhodostoma CBS 690.94]|uniref:RING-type domain-containing protein n=1 Tax=Karstenula rhodostoma CBS 690.94 TaxID=1392251 RepID=A0A9P4P688_9PLEO|nr:hypothetical protein P171DRAFT_526748 [Karstenula rhodostoma CBS 690.94]
MADRDQSDDLRNILLLLRKPCLTKVYHVPSDEHCFICFRDFGAPPDPAGNEPPCQPMQLHPCGHFVGGTCHTKLAFHHQTRCLVCTRDITYTTAVPKIPSILCKMNPPRRSLLFAQLFSRGPYTKREALRLWFTHLEFLYLYMLTVACAFVAFTGLRTCARSGFRFAVSNVVTLSELHDYLLGYLVGTITTTAAVTIVAWNDGRRLVPCRVIGVTAFLTEWTQKLKTELSFMAAACLVLAPFVLYAVCYAFIAGWLIYLGWRHHT